MDVTISASVVNADGSPFYNESHNWYNVAQSEIDWFNKKLKESADNLTKLTKQPKDDDGNYTVTLKAKVGNSTWPDSVFTGVSYGAIVKQERHWLGISDELVKIGEKMAKDRKKK